MLTEIRPSSINKIKVEPQSSLISYLELDPQSMILNVGYKSGKHKGTVRSYEPVSLNQFFQLLNAESVGKSMLKLAERIRNEESSEYIQDKPSIEL